MAPTVTEEARERAEALLRGNGGELGVLGSARAYRQVWARDSMVCGFGLLLCEGGLAIHRRSLATLQRFQTPLGNVPHHVGLADEDDPALLAHGGRLGTAEQAGQVVVDTAHSGCVDGALWYLISHYYTAQQSGEVEALRAAWPSLERALLWLRYQDSNECGLLEVHEAKDWADLFANRYNVLYSNVLYCAAWQSMGHMAQPAGPGPCPLLRAGSRREAQAQRAALGGAGRAEALGLAGAHAPRVALPAAARRGGTGGAPLLPPLHGLPRLRGPLRHAGQPAGCPLRRGRPRQGRQDSGLPARLRAERAVARARPLPPHPPGRARLARLLPTPQPEPAPPLPQRRRLALRRRLLRGRPGAGGPPGRGAPPTGAARRDEPPGAPRPLGV